MDFVPVKCPSCGGALQLPNDKDRVKCMYCGNDILVKKAISDAAAERIPNLLTIANTALKAENYEEAAEKFSQALEFDSSNLEGWIGKGIASGHLLGHLKDAETCFAKAIEIDSSVSARIDTCRNDSRSFQTKCLFEKAKELFTKGMVHFESSTYTYAKRDGDFLGNLARESSAKETAKAAALAKGKPDFLEALKYINQAIEIDAFNYDFLLLKRNIGKALKDSTVALESAKSANKALNAKLETDPKNISLLETKFYVAKVMENKDMMKATKEKIRAIDPKHKLAKKDSACFIATAAYGSPLEPHVEFLRNWRDAYLLKNVPGEIFVKIYYIISPPIARWISLSEKRKQIVRYCLDKLISLLKR